MIVTNIPNLSTKVQRYTGFTLAEVLITLGIVGVVAAMTIPTLMKNYQNVQYYSAFQKGYAEISQIIQDLIYENVDMVGAISEYGSIAGAIKAKAKIVKTCPGGTLDGECMPSNAITKNINNAPSVENLSARDRHVFQDGISVNAGTNSNTCTRVYANMQDLCGEIIMDTNGIKPPNTRGRDIFYFFVTKNKLIPDGAPGSGHLEWIYWYCNPKISDQNGGKACATKLLQEGKMNY